MSKKIKVMKGGGIIDKLIDLTTPRLAISELPTDIEEINCYHNDKPGCIKCKICGSKSGTLRLIIHDKNCKYYIEEKKGPFEEGLYKKPINKINPKESIGILQREYGIINNKSEKIIIGSFGAGPCIILCMRDRVTTETILAHIDIYTLNPLNEFFKFDPKKTDVYIVGGNSLDELNKILIELKESGFEIKFSHIIVEESNSFAINCITGEFYINDDIDPTVDLPLLYDGKKRLSLFNFKLNFKSELTKLNIPIKKNIQNIIKNKNIQPNIINTINKNKNNSNIKNIKY